MASRPIRICDIGIHLTSREPDDIPERRNRTIELVPSHPDDEDQPSILLTPSEAAALGGLLLAAAAAAPSMGPDFGDMYGPIEAVQEYGDESDDD